MRFIVEVEQEDDGRWIADIPQLPGVLVYGASPEEARAKVQALRSGSWQTASRTASLMPTCSRYLLPLHDALGPVLRPDVYSRRF